MIFTTEDGTRFDNINDAKAHEAKLEMREALAGDVADFLADRSPDVDVSKRAVSAALNIISDWNEWLAKKAEPKLAAVPSDKK